MEYIMAVLLFFILWAAKFLIINDFIAHPVQKKNMLTMNFSIKYWTFKDSNINPMSRPINIQKNIYINNAKLKLKSARGNK